MTLKANSEKFEKMIMVATSMPQDVPFWKTFFTVPRLAGIGASFCFIFVFYFASNALYFAPDAYQFASAENVYQNQMLDDDFEDFYNANEYLMLADLTF